MLTLTFLGHAAFLVEGDGKRVIFDPFLTGNPGPPSPPTASLNSTPSS
ncbi:MAG TPA: MBL fold metallo-hydrolase [Gemmatimonadales bacterium]|nr:MBL fold metallo-hydrolase [Gemmatimonadales bacterium]